MMSAAGNIGSDRESETAAFVNLARRGSVSSGTPKTRVEERIKLSVHGICQVGQFVIFFVWFSSFCLYVLESFYIK